MLRDLHTESDEAGRFVWVRAPETRGRRARRIAGDAAVVAIGYAMSAVMLAALARPMLGW